MGLTRPRPGTNRIVPATTNFHTQNTSMANQMLERKAPAEQEMSDLAHSEDHGNLLYIRALLSRSRSPPYGAKHRLRAPSAQS